MTAIKDITVRDMSFKLEAFLAKDWADNDPFLTAMINALSLSFPEGEKHFIRSVRRFKDDISNDKLKEDVKSFIHQEAMHTREHIKYNKMLCDQRGYDLDKLEKPYVDKFKKFNADPKANSIVKLAFTVGMEHITATFAESFLKGEIVNNVNNPVAELWQWHSLEEVEHRSVAFDVYNELNGSERMKHLIIKIAVFDTLSTQFRIAIKMLRHDKKLWRFNTFKSIIKFFFSKKGVLRSNYQAYKKFFDTGFHPDNNSDEFLEPWKNKFLNNELLSN